MNIKKQIILMTLLIASLLTVSFANDNNFAKLNEVLLNQNPDPANPGDYVEIRFKVEKEGNAEIRDIEYELIPKYPFSFDSSDTPIKKLEDWAGNSEDDEFFILYYKLKVDENALEDDYDLTLLQSSAGISAKKEIEFTIRVDEKKTAKLAVGTVKTEPSKLIANYDEGLVEVEIINNGEKEAEQVIIEMQLPEGFEESFGYSNRVNLGSISAGESKSAKFYVDTLEGVSKGIHESKLFISYTEDQENSEDRELTDELDFNIQVFGRPEYELVEVITPDVIGGEIAQIKLKIKNIGSRESDSTSIQIFKDSSQPFDFPDKSDFIGKMDVNEEGEVVFDIEVDDNPDVKEYKLKLQVRSVIDSDVLVEDETISIKVVEQKIRDGESNIGTYILMIIILVAGFVIGRKVNVSNIKKK